MASDEYERVVWAVEHDFYRPGGNADTFAGKLLARWLLQSFQPHPDPDSSTLLAQLGDAFTVASFLNNPAADASSNGLADTLDEAFNHEWAEAETAFALAYLGIEDEPAEFELIERLQDEVALVSVRITWFDTLSQRPLAEVVAPYLETAKQQLAAEAGRQDAGPND